MRTLVILAVTLILSIPRPAAAAGSTKAPVHSLASALLHHGDLPSSFGSPTFRIYTRYAPRITANGAFCQAVPSFLHSLWTQALIQRAVQPPVEASSDAPTQANVSWCGYLFKTAADAQTLYRNERANFRWEIAHDGARSVHIPAIGDAVTVSTTVSSQTVTTSSGKQVVKQRTYTAVVLRANSVITVGVTGSSGSHGPTAASFTHLLQTLEARLH
jgi:hypothetical protein